MGQPDSSIDIIHTGLVGEYGLVREYPPTSAEWDTLDRDIQSCGFKRLGLVTFSFAPLVILSAYSDGVQIFTIMGNPTQQPLVPLEYEFYTELEDDRSITTSTMQAAQANPGLGIYKESVERAPPKTILDQHRLHIQRFGKPQNDEILTIVDVVKSMDRFLARESGLEQSPGETMSTSHPNQLGIPVHPLADPQAIELARVWSSADQQYFVLNVEPYQDEPAVWGIFALDLMKHAARAYTQFDSRSKEETYKQILSGFMAEMEDPTESL